MYCSPLLLPSSARWGHRSPRPPIGPPGGLSPPGSDQPHHPTATESMSMYTQLMQSGILHIYHKESRLSTVETGLLELTQS